MCDYPTFVVLSKMWFRSKTHRHKALLENDALWDEVFASSRLFDALDEKRREKLRKLASRFCEVVHFSGAHEFEVDSFVRLSIAAQACLLVLELGLEYLSEVRTVILYPDAFVAYREEEDEIGVVHVGYEALDGESIEQGSVVLAWEEARPDRGASHENLVLHEFAHKLDERSGICDGAPPLPSGMDAHRWQQVFSAAFERLCFSLDAGDAALIDEYAATSPAEFFAVCVEYFFVAPSVLFEAFPDVYGQLREFFRQDPLGFVSGVDDVS